ncbi:unnamed protein product [Trichobilharzia regenti]|nr:unnamed protein product [Trichobilharzia regenti]
MKFAELSVYTVLFLFIVVIVNNIPSTKTNSSNNNNNQISHWINLINLSAFELFTYIEYYSLKCSEVSGHSPFLWPPPDDMQERLIKLWFDQLSEFLLTSNTTTTTTDIIYDISHWLRAFDLYLFTPCRLKWSIESILLPTAPRYELTTSQRFILDPKAIKYTSTRLFIPSVIIYLGQLLHQLSMNTLDRDKYLSKKEHFLIGRCAGLLTTFLTKNLLVNRQNIEVNSNSCESEDENIEVDFQAIEYDEMWIWKKSCISLSDTRIQPVYGSIFTNLVNCLARLSLKEPPRVCYAPPLSEHTLDSMRNQYPSCNVSLSSVKQIQIIDSTWTACLLQLYQIKYSPAMKCIHENKELNTKLNTTAAYLDNLTSMNILSKKLNISCTEELLDNSQTGWLVSGYLPRITDCRYTCSVFWRPLKDNRNHLLHLC